MNGSVDFKHRGNSVPMPVLVPKTYVNKHLNEVEIAGFRGTSNQIDFVIFLLKHVALSMDLAPPTQKVLGGSDG